jgi:hypothetical protein
MARQQGEQLAAVPARFSRIIRRSPRDGFNGVLRALVGDRAFLPPSRATSVTPTGLASASGGQDHTTSPSASAPLVRMKDRCASPKRPSHPAPRVVTIAMRPSSSRRDARPKHIFWKTEAKFSRTIETAKSALNRLANFVLSRTGFDAAQALDGRVGAILRLGPSQSLAASERSAPYVDSPGHCRQSGCI